MNLSLNTEEIFFCALLIHITHGTTKNVLCSRFALVFIAQEPNDVLCSRFARKPNNMVRTPGAENSSSICISHAH